jgi:hypothetical protein
MSLPPFFQKWKPSHCSINNKKNAFSTILKKYILHIACSIYYSVGRDSSVEIAPCYWLEFWRSNSGWGENFRARPARPWDPPSVLYNGYRLSFAGVKRPGRGVNHSPQLSPILKKSRPISVLLCAFTAWCRPNSYVSFYCNIFIVIN